MNSLEIVSVCIKTQYLLATMVTLVMIGCSTSQKEIAAEAKSMEKSFRTVDFRKTAQTRTAVINAANSEKAVVFVHVDWNLEFGSDRIRFAEFAIRYQRLYPEDKLNVHYVDFSPDHTYASLRSLPGWKELEIPNYSLINGEQEIVWMAKGRVLMVEPIHSFPTVSDLIVATRKVYQQPNRTSDPW